MITNLICSIMLMLGSGVETPALGVQNVNTVTENPVFTTDSISRAPSDEHCSVELSVDYPTDGPQALVDSVRSYIAEEMKSFYMARLDGDGEPRPATYTGSLADGKALVDFHAEHLLADIQDIYKSVYGDDKRTDLYMTNQSSIKKVSENDSIVTYEAGCYQFEGGVHGLYWLEGTTFRKSDGSRIVIDLDPFMVDQMQPLLREGLEQYLKDNGSETTVDDLVNGGTFMSDGQIPLPSSNPYLTADGVKFVYQEFEIGPHALGLPTFTIPLEKLKPYLAKPDEE